MRPRLWEIKRLACRPALGAVLFCLSGVADCQIRELAATDDGSVLYFSSPFRIRGSTQSFQPKIFVADAAGVRLFAGEIPGAGPKYYQMSAPDVSGDGLMTVYTGGSTEYQVVCGGPHTAPFHCVTETTVYAQSLVQQAGVPVADPFNGGGRISANGRYLLLTLAGTVPRLLDLSTGERMDITGPALPDYSFIGRRAVASDGTVLFGSGVNLFLWGKGVPLRQFEVVYSSAIVDDAAARILYTKGMGLYSLDVATGATHLVANGSAPSTSRDGRWIAFLSPVAGVNQAWLVHPDGTALRQLTSDPAGIAAATISGNGDVVFTANSANQVMKVDLTAGTMSEVVPATLIPIYGAYPFESHTVPGSQGVIRGAGLAAGDRVLLNDEPVPIVSIAPDEIRYQVPWETVPGTPVTVRVDVPGALFEAPGYMSPAEAFYPVYELLPACVEKGWVCALAYHADSAGAVTGDDPARPNELLRVIMRGLGAVSPPVATGAASPANPPATVRHAITCRMETAGDYLDAPVLAANLLPGAVGLYEVQILVPARVWTPSVGLFCGGTSYNEIALASLFTVPAP